MAAEPNSVTFETTVAVTGNNTGIVVPEQAIGQLAAGKRPAVLVNINGYDYRNTVGVMGGKHMISISAAVRKATGLQGGDPVRVTLTVADTPREVTLPPTSPPRSRPMTKPAHSSASSPTACSGITLTTSPPPRAPTPGSAVSIRPLACSAPASKGDDTSAHRGMRMRLISKWLMSQPSFQSWLSLRRRSLSID
jgi:uncharacterized protein DUF1905